MPDPVDPKVFLNLCKMSIDSMNKLKAIGELLEQKGLLTKQEILDLATDLKRKNPPTDPTKEPFTAKENAVIEELMAVILQRGLSADHAKVLLGRTIHLLDWGKQVVNEMPEANA